MGDCEQLKVEETFIVEVPDNKGKINSAARANENGGINNVLRATEVNLIAGSDSVERLGVVIDADQDLEARWRKILSILRTAGYKALPERPDPSGTVVEEEYLPVFGVWIMPDNQIRGILEDFLSFLVPPDDKIWEKAVQCSEEVFAMPAESFAEIHLSKAKIHAYLAWQKDCGKPFGQAITARYLQSDRPECEKFVHWLRRLFVD